MRKLKKTYESKVAKKQLDRFREQKRINLIPEFIYLISQWHLDVTKQETTLMKMFELIESNLAQPFFRKYRMLRDGIDFMLAHLQPLNTSMIKKLEQYKKHVRGVMRGDALHGAGQ